MAVLTGTLIAAGVAAAGAVGGAAISANGQRRAADTAAGAAADANNTQLQIYNQQRSDAEPWRQTGLQALDRLGSYYGFTPTSQAGTPPRNAVVGDVGMGGTSDGAPRGAPVRNALAVARGEAQPGNALATTQALPYTDQRTAQPASTGPGGSQMDWLRNTPGYQFRLDEGIRGRNALFASQGRRLSGGTLKALERYGQDYASSEFDKEWNRLSGLAGIGQQTNQSNNALATNYANQTGANTINAGNQRASAYADNGATWGQTIGQIGGIASDWLTRPRTLSPALQSYHQHPGA